MGLPPPAALVDRRYSIYTDSHGDYNASGNAGLSRASPGLPPALSRFALLILPTETVHMWCGILGHDDVAERFRRTLRSGRLASTYLFVGPLGIGKRRFALALARSLLCGTTDDADLAPCGQCESCRLVATGNHPDLELIGLPPDKASLPIALFIGDDTHRNQEGLCHRIALRPFLGRRKVAIIDDADHFRQESANCLLKTLEEPPAHSLLILIGTSLGRQLPTILSRAQIVQFRPLPPSVLQQVLLAERIVGDAEQAARLAEASDGSVARARELANADLWAFREQWDGWLRASSVDEVRAARLVLEFVDAAGKEGAARRARLRMVVGFAVEHFRRRMRTTQSIESADRLEHCLTALEHIDRNVNLATLVGWWLGGLTRPRSVPVDIRQGPV